LLLILYNVLSATCTDITQGNNHNSTVLNERCIRAAIIGRWQASFGVLSVTARAVSPLHSVPEG